MEKTKYGYWPKTQEELLEVIRDCLEEGANDYGKSAEAMHDAAIATFNYMSHMQGNTGFQASYAALKMLGTINGYEGPYGLIKADNMLFPQYPTGAEQGYEFHVKWRDWLQEAAKEKMAEFPDGPVTKVADDGFTMTSPHPNVWAHWEKLANGVLPGVDWESLSE